jgi:hypothetical protein
MKSSYKAQRSRLNAQGSTLNAQRSRLNAQGSTLKAQAAPGCAKYHARSPPFSSISVIPVPRYWKRLGDTYSISKSSHRGSDINSRKCSVDPHHGPHTFPSILPFLYLHLCQLYVHNKLGIAELLTYHDRQPELHTRSFMRASLCSWNSSTASCLGDNPLIPSR